MQLQNKYHARPQMLQKFAGFEPDKGDKGDDDEDEQFVESPSPGKPDGNEASQEVLVEALDDAPANKDLLSVDAEKYQTPRTKGKLQPYGDNADDELDMGKNLLDLSQVSESRRAGFIADEMDAAVIEHELSNRYDRENLVKEESEDDKEESGSIHSCDVGKIVQ